MDSTTFNNKILYDKSIKLAALLPNSLNAARKVSSEPSLPKVVFDLGGTGAAAGTMPSIPTSTAPSISGVVTLQENSITSVATAAKRFHSF